MQRYDLDVFSPCHVGYDGHTQPWATETRCTMLCFGLYGLDLIPKYLAVPSIRIRTVKYYCAIEGTTKIQMLHTFRDLSPGLQGTAPTARNNIDLKRVTKSTFPFITLALPL